MNVHGDGHAPAERDGVPTAAEIVHALLARHKVDRRRYAAAVADALKLSRAAAHHRVNGNAAWLWDDLVRIGECYGETMLDMLRGVMGKTYTAQLLIDKHKSSVLVRLGDGRPDRGDTWAAFHRHEGGLVVMPVDQVPATFEPIKVAELVHSQYGHTPLRVAVLDDSADTAASLAEMLSGEGCSSKAYTSSQALLADLEAGRQYDSFVLDWWLGNNTAEAVIAELRRISKQARIVLLTGEMGAGGKADIDAIEQAQKRYQFFVSQKPITAGLLMANLTLDV
jgi:CheY-like chemotaxis protein